ncbi:hypothetical protein [Halorubrum cibi]|uniref:hypothetical protein n=1 Tax=Halorubrum cibi TaxID=413815 RepID=UPI00115F0F95|nr:hypothetical protein [Halorubrum cibi]
MSAPDAHSTCTVPEFEQFARLIGEAHEVGDKVAVVTESSEIAVITRKGARDNINTIAGELDIEIFLSKEASEDAALEDIRNEVEITIVERIPGEMAADESSIFINNGALTESRDEIVNTKRQHLCSHDKDPANLIRTLLQSATD